jgi:hypothetical protein
MRRRGGADTTSPLPRNVIAATGEIVAKNLLSNNPIGPGHRHTYWRLFPAQTIAGLRESIFADLDRISAIDPMLRNALRGSAVAAIALASELQCERYPFHPNADLVMTALMRCALEGDAAAAAMMADVTGSCLFDHDHGPRLADSWFYFDPQSVSNTRDAPSNSA